MTAVWVNELRSSGKLRDMVRREGTDSAALASALLALVAVPVVACGSAPTAGRSADAGGAAGTGDTGAACAGGAGESASFCWVEASEGHRERAAASAKRAIVQTHVRASFDTSLVVGTSTLFIADDEQSEEYKEGIVWTEATGTLSLGGLPGANPSIKGSVLSDPRAVSADGSVVVGVAASSQNHPAAFRWTRTDGMEAIAEYGSAIAVSADGAVVLGQQTQPAQRGFRWTRELGAVMFDPFPGSVTTSVFALSEDGGTVLGKSYWDGDSAGSLFVWTEASGMRVVENLPGYRDCLAGPALTHGMIVAGPCYDQSGRSEPYLWVGQDGLRAMGPADMLGGHKPASAVAVTVDGSVAVGQTVAVPGESRVYRWTETNGFELIELPEGYTTNATTPGPGTMSDDGAVVVGRLEGLARHSFLWSAGVGTVVLSPIEGHEVSYVYAVSGDGSIAVGTTYRVGSAGAAEDFAAVYWRADGVPHRIVDELAVHGIDVGGGTISDAHAAHPTRGFFGSGWKSEAGGSLAWHARLP
jgi:probable HAF family extracellular repeat protein